MIRSDFDGHSVRIEDHLRGLLEGAWWERGLQRVEVLNGL